MNPYQKVAILILRFVALSGLVTGIGQVVFWTTTVYGLTQGSTVMQGSIETSWLAFLGGGFRGPMMLAGLWVAGSLILLAFSRPIGRAMGRDLGTPVKEAV